MKKNYILLLLLITLFTLTNHSQAAADELLHFKLGYNSTGLELEKSLDHQLSFYLSETMYRRRDRWNTEVNLQGAHSIAYTTMIGLRKHTQLMGQNVFFGGGAGLSGFDPTINGHLGYQIKLSQLSNPIYLRAETGFSTIMEITKDVGLEAIFHFGISVGSEIDLDFSRIYY